MSRKYKFNNPEGLYFVTDTVVDWIDFFTREEYREVLIESLKHCQEEKGLVIHSWCLMTNHLHMIISSHKSPLQFILRDFKRHTSTVYKDMLLGKDINESRSHWLVDRFTWRGSRNVNSLDWQFWKQGSHPIEIDTAEMLEQKWNTFI
jgi:putative transposase